MNCNIYRDGGGMRPVFEILNNDGGISPEKSAACELACVIEDDGG